MFFSKPITTLFWVVVLGSLLLAACNSAETDADGDLKGSGLVARIDGKAWQATAISATASASAGVPGSIMILGSDVQSGKTVSLTVLLYNIKDTGTFPLGTAISVYGGTGHVGEGTGSGGDALTWMTEGTGRDGEVVITSLANKRIKGTFHYSAVPGPKNTTGTTRTVTDGQFDLPLAGTLAAVPDNQGSTLSATLNGEPYHAASITAYPKDYLGGQGLTLSSITSKHALNFMLSNATGPGTYVLDNRSPARNMTAGRTGVDTACCWGAASGLQDSGVVIITSMTATRVKGSFHATLHPRNGSNATQKMTVADGIFDVGLMDL
jgi:hypothetical protein